MVMLKPFKAIRPSKELVHKVAALPYDVMNSDEAREMVKGNRYSFLHVDKAEVDLDKNINIYDKKVYEKAKENLYNMIEEGTLQKDNKAMIFVYRLIMNGRSQTGIVGVTSIDDYMNNIIKKHEYTREEKEIDRINHVDICSANTGPIFLTYRDNEKINSIIENCTKENPLYNFTAKDGVQHIVWSIEDENIVDKICTIFKEISNLYIADGHHRTASAVKVGLKRRDENPNYTGEEEFNYFLSVIFPKSALSIMDYNRVVKDTNGLSEKELLKMISKKFKVEVYTRDKTYKPTEKNIFGMYLKGKWYKLTAKPGSFNEDLVEGLDVSILQNTLLTPILNIQDPRTDDRIEFVGGIRGLQELEKKAGNEGVAFSMYPTTIDELMDISDADKVMPPKSTWFEPKLRSGLFIHEI
ncbi:DUF1015 domain-containing protein [Haloimpatiens sp. FM7330]|uniref:DUF1015 domain-containing protein n=1 Tax=Haloimpatiens sp. FM7330 TaxID=3298610 RepID=UPI00363CA0CC